MLTTLGQLVPVFASITLGYVLQRTRIATARDGELLFRIVFYICGPAIIFRSLYDVDIRPELMVFPVAAGVWMLAGYIAGRLLAPRMHLGAYQVGVFMSACMIANTGFVLPFAQALYGTEGIARLVMFDLVNATLVFTVVFAIAAKSNPDHDGEPFLLKKLLRSPPLYATALGLAVKASGVEVPKVILDTTSVFGTPIGFVTALATGILFVPKLDHVRAGVASIVTRGVIGLAIATAVTLGFDLEGVDRTVVYLLAAAPVGFNVVTFASIEKLDLKFAAGTLSLSLASGFVLCTIVSVILG